MAEHESKIRRTFGDLVDIMKRLRAPGGCPWDAEQTLESLRRYILEESHELVESIEEDDARGVCEECGDVLLQVVFVATVAAERGMFDIGDVTDAICRKLVVRHPHVFGDTTVHSADDVSRNWERIKAGERKRRDADSSAMAGIPRGLPALLRALRIQERAAKKGFDWERGDVASVRGKVLEELGELRAEVERTDRAATEEELGDLLFAVVNMARHLGIEPESALQSANAKFADRFRAVEAIAAERDIVMEETPLDDLDKLWVEAKELKKSRLFRGGTVQMSEIAQKIQDVIAEDIRPVIESHGGGIDFVGFDEANGLLTVRLTGVCGGCPGAQATIRNMVEGVIQQSVPEVKEVVRA